MSIQILFIVVIVALAQGTYTPETKQNSDTLKSTVSPIKFPPNIDSIQLYIVNKTGFDGDSTDSCNVIIGQQIYSHFLHGVVSIKKLDEVLSNSKIELNRNAYFKFMFQENNEMIFYFSGNNLSQAFLDKDGILYNIKFAKTFSKVLKGLHKKHRISALSPEAKEEIMSSFQRYLSHVNRFDKTALDALERPHIHRDIDLNGLKGMADFVKKFKSKTSAAGLIAVWDTTNLEYILEWPK
jgi:hypothetical protein